MVDVILDITELTKLLQEHYTKQLGREVREITITSHDSAKISIQACPHGIFEAVAFKHRLHDYK